MWRLKIKIDVSNMLMGSYCVKHNVSLRGYPLTHQIKGKSVLFLGVGNVFGEDKSVNSFCEDIKKNKDVLEFERNGNFLFMLSRHPINLKILFDSSVFWSEPQLINPSGFAIWDLASFKKEPLDKIVKFAEKNKGKILSFKEEKIGSLGVVNSIPSLSSKQKEALELAKKNGYYSIPRKIGLVKLSKKMGVSLATYQVHLRKAEEKLIPFMSDNFC